MINTYKCETHLLVSACYACRHSHHSGLSKHGKDKSMNARSEVGETTVRNFHSIPDDRKAFFMQLMAGIQLFSICI